MQLFGRAFDRLSHVLVSEDFERELMSNLNALAARLREGRYYPMPARMFEMKKASGGVRKLAILSVEDRIVQRAALDVIEPIFEAAFFDCSFGFRPNATCRWPLNALWLIAPLATFM